MGALTTHVLDTAQGQPGHGIEVQLFKVDHARTLLCAHRTNADGRTDTPLLNTEAFELGTFELVFAVADYFQATPLGITDPPFLDDVTIRFTISEDTHYHIPLLVSPWSYSTYRGS